MRFTTVVFDQRGRFHPISLKLIEIIYENASEFQPVNWGFNVMKCSMKPLCSKVDSNNLRKRVETIR